MPLVRANGIAVLSRPLFHHRSALLGLLCVSLSGCSWMQTALRLRDGMGRSLADRAMEAKSEGDTEEAVRLLTEATERDPDQADLHRELADLCHDCDRCEVELRHRKRVAELAPDSAESWSNLALAFEQQGDLRHAKAAVDQALKRDPSNTDALLVRARVLQEAGESTEALEAYHRLLDVDPSDVEARLAVARIHLRMGHADRAAPVLRSLCSCPLVDQAEKSDAWWSLGIAYGRIGRWTDAVRALETGSRAHDTADDWYRLAFAQRRAGNLGGARRALDEVRRRQPAHDGGRKLAIVLAQAETGVRTVGFDDELPVPTGWETRIQ